MSNTAKIQRIKKRDDFLRAAKQGQKWVTRRMVIQAFKRDDDGENVIRVGFTATKKTGNAVRRNRIKRRMRVLAQDILPTVKAQGYDIVMIGRYKAATHKFAYLQDDFLEALKKLGLTA